MIDLHNHTILCNHANDSIDEYINKAIQKGIVIYGFSEHGPMEFDEKYRMSFDEMDIYESWLDKAKEKYKDKIKILKGYEVDFTPEVDKRVLDRNVDYLIGSVHFLDNWGFDNPEFLSEWSERDVDDIYKEYFELIQKMAESKMFDIVGHLDLIKVFGYRPQQNDIKLIAKKAIESIADNKMVVEINTAGIRKKVNEVYPGVELLEMIKKANIDITFGSDAHSKSQVGFYLKESYELAKMIGFKRVAYFENKEKKYKNL
jgi:histidinol-phosphatase (PHP family)